MERKTAKTRQRREVEQFFNAIAIRSMIVLLLAAFVALFVARPPWAVKTVRLLLDVARGEGTFY